MIRSLPLPQLLPAVAALVLCLFVLGGCVAAPSNPTPTTACATEIGQKKADELVQRCRMVSPATHSPCNTANSCITIQSEIDRSCALLGDNPPDDCAVRP